MDLNLYMVKSLPLRPHRSCLKKTGPGDVNLIAIELMPITSSIGMPKMHTMARSMIRRTKSSASFVGVVLKDSNGNSPNRSSSVRAKE